MHVKRTDRNESQQNRVSAHLQIGRESGRERERGAGRKNDRSSVSHRHEKCEKFAYIIAE